EQAGLHGGYAHALPVQRIETANGVPDGNQTARKFQQPLEIAPHAGGEIETEDLAEASGVANRIVESLRAQPLEEGHNALDVAGGSLVVTSPQAEEPTIALQRENGPAA